MKPTDFPESNVVFAKDQPEYLQLPALAHKDTYGQVTSCWEVSTLWERIVLLFTGRVYVTLLTFHQPLAPQIVSVTCPKVEKE